MCSVYTLLVNTVDFIEPFEGNEHKCDIYHHMVSTHGQAAINAAAYNLFLTVMFIYVKANSFAKIICVYTVYIHLHVTISITCV